MVNIFSSRSLCVLIFWLSIDLINAQTPLPLVAVVGDTLPYVPTALWDQTYNPGNNSITSQNFESSLDNYDSYAAEHFGLMDDIWSVTRVEVRGAYYGGTGNAESVNVWFYTDSAGLPNQLIHSSLNVIPSNGLTSGSFSIPLSSPLELNEGLYWVCVQANMNFNSSGQWGWTTSNDYFFEQSVWKNPGNGFGSICTDWNYRASNCGIGTAPGLCFALIGDIVPVELTSFNATVIANNIELKWHTATELNNSGFEIERKFSNSDWEKIDFVEGNGTTSEENDYSYTDKNIKNGKYFYRLKQLDYDGSFEYSKEVEIEFLGITEFSLSQNYPNPFNPSTRIKYHVSSISHVTLKVYDVLGNEIATLVDEEKPSGMYNAQFTMNNLSSGIYFYRLTAGDFVSTKKMIYLK
jgi:hypothetical protein